MRNPLGGSLTELDLTQIGHVLFNDTLNPFYLLLYDVIHIGREDYSLVLAAPVLLYVSSHIQGARCSSVVRAFAHGTMCRRIDPSWGGPFELFLVPASAPQLMQQRPWYVLSCFLSHYQSGPLPYVRRHITVNKMC